MRLPFCTCPTRASRGVHCCPRVHHACICSALGETCVTPFHLDPHVHVRLQLTSPYGRSVDAMLPPHTHASVYHHVPTGAAPRGACGGATDSLPRGDCSGGGTTGGAGRAAFGAGEVRNKAPPAQRTYPPPTPICRSCLPSPPPVDFTGVRKSWHAARRSARRKQQLLPGQRCRRRRVCWRQSRPVQPRRRPGPTSGRHVRQLRLRRPRRWRTPGHQPRRCAGWSKRRSYVCSRLWWMPLRWHAQTPRYQTFSRGYLQPNPLCS